MTNLYSTITIVLARLVPNAGAPDQIDADAQLAQELGVTSMQMVLLITTLCRTLGVSMTAFDEDDLAAMISVRAIAARFQTHLPEMVA
ncbi:acyl carrier protein [Undibacterium sp. GrIS 1.2]